ncbi:MAG: hypothetical protein JWP12_1538 [Bacteroidetes bacterium]|nr:hypothetical protein [Bacteroidota bacterium]
MKKKFPFYFLSILLFSCSGNGHKSDALAGNGKLSADGSNADLMLNENTPVLDAAAYVRWMQDPENGLKKEKKIDELTFSVQYKTPEYVTCMELRGRPCTDSVLRKNIGELKDMQYYDLKILLNDGSSELLKYKNTSPQQYNDRVNYFAFGMQNDLALVDGNDTLRCDLYHYERAYDVTPSATMLLGFIKKSNNDKNDKTLIFYDRTFNKGMLKFKFAATGLYNKPKLKTL